ncbi:putative adp-ribose 1 -phosphate phosphatase protein [Phaeoacremonium minimum UCRPA7]|uniref:Putative adp-ribose 1-phosphate phosphatase protein n=1 Tax=Phaeoacremonium minimum (strain UCR-PA7) TaxID=1286976 RepID=R8BVK2_PHAM7|nr:putative adp-ribose 1 -phosphate phosphatase protein [Phaeoacremonium minimum UCRPA7]EOO03329.1 putative adp-ribose 1 -phosphate phosphatase protein [Phaeoacremonium minimum UCRPA7]
MWGAGIAAELATIFPAACEVYKTFCNDAKADESERWPPRSLAGQCLIIPPQESDVAAGAPRVSIVCVFTSYGYGRANPAKGKPGKDTAATILRQTRTSLAELRRQLDELKGKQRSKEEPMIIYSPRFNSGAFKVPWTQTEAVIKEKFEGWQGKWIVLEPPS